MDVSNLETWINVWARFFSGAIALGLDHRGGGDYRIRRVRVAGIFRFWGWCFQEVCVCCERIRDWSKYTRNFGVLIQWLFHGPKFRTMVGGQQIIIQPCGWASGGQCCYPEMTQREVMNFSTQNAKCINAKGVSDSRECHCGNGWIQWLGWTRLNTYTELSSRVGPRFQELWITFVFSPLPKLQRTPFFGLVFTQPGTLILRHPCSPPPGSIFATWVGSLMLRILWSFLKAQLEKPLVESSPMDMGINRMKSKACHDHGTLCTRGRLRLLFRHFLIWIC